MRFLTVARETAMSWMAFRGFFFSLAFQWLLPPFVALFVWTAALKSSGRAGEIGWVTSFYLLMMIVNQFTYSYEHWTVGDAIRTGRYSRYLLKPMHPMIQAAAENVGGKMVFMSFNIPMVLILWVFFRSTIALDAYKLLFFAVSLALAAVLRFLWGHALATAALWLTRASSLLLLSDALLFLLGGQAAPTAMFPQWLSDLAGALPFRYMLALPVELLLGSHPHGEALRLLAVQSVWVLGVGCVSWAFWHLSMRQYQSTGG